MFHTAQLGNRLSKYITYKQDRQRKYNVALRHVRVTIVAVEKQDVLHILSVCLYP